MDAKTCLQKLQYVGVLAFATVDEHGAPQIRNISAIHYEPEAMYFFTAKGRTSAASFWPMGGCRFWATQSTKR